MTKVKYYCRKCGKYIIPIDWGLDDVEDLTCDDCKGSDIVKEVIDFNIRVLKETRQVLITALSDEKFIELQEDLKEIENMKNGMLQTDGTHKKAYHI